MSSFSLLLASVFDATSLAAGGRLTTENKYIYIQAPLFLLHYHTPGTSSLGKGDVDCEEAAQVTGTDTE